MDYNVTVTDPIECGKGNLTSGHPEWSQDDAEAEALIIRNKYLVEVEDKTPAGCMDGRKIARMLDGSAEVKTGYKTAGGVAETGLFAFSIDGYFEPGTHILTNAARVMHLLEDDGTMPIRFHVTEGHADEVLDVIVSARTNEALQSAETEEGFIKALIELDVPDDDTGCGMGDQFDGAFRNMARVPQTYEKDGETHAETEKDVDARIEALATLAEAIEPTFDRATFDRHVENATKLVEAGYLDDFSATKLLILADYVLGGHSGDGDGVLGRIDVLAGQHTESLFLVIEGGHTLDETKYVEETENQAFCYNKNVGKHLASISMPKSGDVASNGILHGANEANLAGAYQLGNGTHRAAYFALAA